MTTQPQTAPSEVPPQGIPDKLKQGEPNFGKFIDLNMLVITGGLERKEAEFRKLLEASGFRLERVVNTDSTISTVEAAPA